MRSDGKQSVCQCGNPKLAKSKHCIHCHLRIVHARRRRSGPEPPVIESNLNKPFPMGGNEAAKYGATVTLENKDGKTLVLHRTGPPGTAIRQAFNHATQLDPSFLIISVSTPTSIYTDLQGPRASVGGGYGDNPSQPEDRIGDMKHPRLKATARGTTRRSEKP